MQPWRTYATEMALKYVTHPTFCFLSPSWVWVNVISCSMLQAPAATLSTLFWTLAPSGYGILITSTQK